MSILSLSYAVPISAEINFVVYLSYCVFRNFSEIYGIDI